MLKKNTVAVVLAMALVLGFACGPASAGTVTEGLTKYAAEDCWDVDVTFPAIVYNLGVDRYQNQDFIVIYTLSAGTFSGNPAPPIVPYNSTVPPVDYTVSRRLGGDGFNYVIYEIRVLLTDGFKTNDTITLPGFIVKDSGLGTVGNKVSVSVGLKDWTNTAWIDQDHAIGGDKPRGESVQVAQFVNGVDVGVLADSGTTTDAGANPPLSAFVNQNNDNPGVAKADIEIRKTIAGVMNHTNTDPYVLLEADKINLTITDPTGFQGLAANGLVYNVGGGQVFTPVGNNATVTIDGNANHIGESRVVAFNLKAADEREPLGTSRVLEIAGSITPHGGAPALNFTGRQDWWTWNSNGFQFQAPLVQVPQGWLSRIALSNTSSSNIHFFITLLSEEGNVLTIPPNARTEGEIPANGTIVFDTTEVFTGGSKSPRATMLLTINGIRQNVQGLYQLVNPTAGTTSNHILIERGTN